MFQDDHDHVSKTNSIKYLLQGNDIKGATRHTYGNEYWFKGTAVECLKVIALKRTYFTNPKKLNKMKIDLKAMVAAGDMTAYDFYFLLK